MTATDAVVLPWIASGDVLPDRRLSGSRLKQPTGPG